jgi:ABC-type cobalamin/Fe3+-siderophores transport system ATPase subunit
MPAAVETTGVIKSFDGTWALDGIDVRVPDGTILGLLGPNGAGKTMLVRTKPSRVRWPGEGCLPARLDFPVASAANRFRRGTLVSRSGRWRRAARVIRRATAGRYPDTRADASSLALRVGR